MTNGQRMKCWTRIYWRTSWRTLTRLNWYPLFHCMFKRNKSQRESNAHSFRTSRLWLWSRRSGKGKGLKSRKLTKWKPNRLLKRSLCSFCSSNKRPMAFASPNSHRQASRWITQSSICVGWSASSTYSIVMIWRRPKCRTMPRRHRTRWLWECKPSTIKHVCLSIRCPRWNRSERRSASTSANANSNRSWQRLAIR